MMKKILVIPGSLRKGSYNKMVAKTLLTLAPEDVEMQIFELNGLPLLDQDLEADLPQVVQDFIAKVRWADALIISTPEYNNMLSAPVKNACDWLTRDYSKDAVHNKWLAITGASNGGFGTVRAQNELLMMGLMMRMQVSADLRLPISRAQDIFTSEGELTDESMKERLRSLIVNLVSRL